MAEIMWEPTLESIANSNMKKFMDFVNDAHTMKLQNYKELYQWSIQHKAYFWKSVWQFSNIIASQTEDAVLITSESMRHTQWFTNSKLNFAENLLKRDDTKIALIFQNERNQRITWTYAQLKKDVAKLAYYFRRMGIVKNDRIAAVLPNQPEAIIAMLATTSIGAIWSSCSPDFGSDGLLERFSQIEPKVLITCEGYFYNGKTFSITPTIKQIEQKIPSLQQIILVNNLPKESEITFSRPVILFNAILKQPDQVLSFEQLPFDHPIYIMYSSGTTGAPKCIVHGAGGTLLQHLKELILHTNLTQDDTIFYFTTCGWMMWNWYISSLAIGATLVQYDGAAFWPTPSRLFDLIDQEKITVLGTSAKYLGALQKHQLVPKISHSLSSLKAILSTGSPLLGPQFDYVYQAIKKDLCLSSISGGTDIISCFALGNPILPVYKGELQCIGLGMNVEIYNDDGKSVIGEKGELVCTGPFPSMPVYFWNDPDGSKYQNAYFAKFENTWAQGDFAERTSRDTLIIYGRSDATLNPGGVRIGTAEIYHQVEKFPQIIDSLVIGQDWEEDTRIVLFVVLQKNYLLTEDLKNTLKNTIREYCSPRHVPKKIIQVPDIPKTLSGKTVELAVRDIIHHRPIKNLSAIANPESLECFKDLKELQV